MILDLALFFLFSFFLSLGFSSFNISPKHSFGTTSEHMLPRETTHKRKALISLVFTFIILLDINDLN
jgi:hypothetical protein